MTVPLAIFAATFAVRPLPQPEAPLEPSVQNEVDRAIGIAERWLASHACTNAVPAADIFRTNGLTRCEKAIRLVSMQRSGGWWITSTNSVPTRLALEILKGL